MPVEPLEYLFSLEQFGIKFGLDNIRALLDELDHPERAFASVHVAGTNGKGSVTALVESALRAAGVRTGRYTSPHLVDLTERFAIGGRAVDLQTLTAVVGDVRDAVLALQARGRLSVHPTFFEVTTAAAFEIFRRGSVDVAVCEVGLGGRLDATNVLAPVVSAITSIGFDHEQYLGHTLLEIAAEKAGVIKAGVPVVVGRVDAGVADLMARAAHERGARLVMAHDGVAVEREPADPDGPQRLHVRTPSRDYGVIELALAGEHQIDNAVVALRTLETLDALGVRVPSDAVARGMATVHWPGRLERIQYGDGRELLLDAAHNPAGAAALAAFLATAREKRPLVFAAMRDKDAAGILEALAPEVRAIVLTRASHPRSADPDRLAELVRRIAPALPLRIEEAPRDALAAAWRLHPRIVAAGSIFLLGDIMKVKAAS